MEDNREQLSSAELKDKKRYAWKCQLLPGRLTEWKYRHDHMWPEMAQALKDAGIRNYTIWTDGEELFGYYECDDTDFTTKSQAESKVVDLWNEHMKDVIYMEMDPENGAQPHLTEIFLME